MESWRNAHLRKACIPLPSSPDHAGSTSDLFPLPNYIFMAGSGGGETAAFGGDESASRRAIRCPESERHDRDGCVLPLGGYCLQFLFPPSQKEDHKVARCNSGEQGPGAPGRKSDGTRDSRLFSSDSITYCLIRHRGSAGSCMLPREWLSETYPWKGELHITDPLTKELLLISFSVQSSGIAVAFCTWAPQFFLTHPWVSTGLRKP